MKKFTFLLTALCIGTFSTFGQAKKTTSILKDTVYIDKSFIDAGTEEEDKVEFHLVPKFYKAGVLTPLQPIALTTAKEEAMNLVRAVPSQLRKEGLNIIYTVDPIYDNGNVKGTMKGTILIKWDMAKKIWSLSYLKYQLINIDQNAAVFMYEAE